MGTYVITGGTRGIGRGLARELLQRGQSVVLCGRTAARVEEAVSALQELGPVFGQACDVTDFDQVQSLWSFAVEQCGRVDAWINNAGVAYHEADRQTALSDPAEVALTIDVNLKGALFGCMVALKGMTAQGHGRVYNMEGFGSDGRQMRTGLSTYGASKCGLRYLGRSLAKEHQGSPVQIGTLSPGMVLTDLLLEPYAGDDAKLAEVKRIFNILADHEHTVTPFLADGLVAEKMKVHWLTPGKVVSRFALSLFRKRDLFSELTERGHV